MKEITPANDRPILQAHYPLPKRSQFRKPWIIAQSRKNFELQQGTNRCTEEAYHRIIKAAKDQLKQGESYFERDYKHDKTENCCAMYSFMNSTFYIYLECSLDYEFHVEYAFNNCRFEALLRDMLRPFPLDRQSHEVLLQPDFNTFYKGVLIVQDSKFIHSL